MTIALDPQTEYAALGERDGHLALCERSYGGTITLTEYTTCDELTASYDGPRVSDSGGGDITTIGPLDHSIVCDGVTVNAWDPLFAWGIFYTGYDADDIVYGTPNDDELYSYSSSSAGWDWSSELICGYDGDDLVFGDVSGPVPANPLTCLDGGAGTDTCTDGEMTSDCETTAWYTRSVSTCGCGTAPPTFWIW